MTLRIGSLFSGYGGLDMAVQSVLGGDLAWYSEIEPAACTVLAAHHPGVPNLGDITQVDWATVPPVDILTGGYPCQPFSHAGKRKGTHDERHLWPYVRDAIAALRPMVTVLENVDGHRSLGLDAVLGDLAALGLPARWGVVRAADAGAPHGRKRVFIVVADTDRLAGAQTELRGHRDERRPQRGVDGTDERAGTAAPHPDGDRHGQQLHARGMGSVEGEAAGGAPERQRAGGEPDAGGDLAAADAPDNGLQHPGERVGPGGASATQGHLGAAADASDGERQVNAGHDSLNGERSSQRRGAVVTAGAGGSGVDPVGGLAGPHAATGPVAAGDLGAAADTSSDGRDGRPGESDAVGGGDSGRVGGTDSSTFRDGDGLVNWGKYAPAIHRWERVLGRPAPAPTIPGTNGRSRLSPAFVEWMMGLPAGHVTGHGLPASACLKMLGNGVVPQQAELALRMLLADEVAA